MMEIKLENLPDALYIELPQKHHNRIWNRLLRKNTIIQIAKTQQIPIRNLYKWKEGNSGYPLSEVKKLLKLAKIKIDVISIKTQRDSKSIRNLKLPIKINERFASLLGHLFGDGGIDKQFQLHYTTNDINNVGEVKNLVKTIFGDVEFNEINYGNRVTLVYPKTLGIIVSHITEMSVGSKVDSDNRLSKNILDKMNYKMKIAFIKTFYECDGETNNIAIVQGCKYLDKPPTILLQIKNLLEDLNFKSVIIKPSSIYKITNKTRRRWVLRIADKQEKNKFRRLFF